MRNLLFLPSFTLCLLLLLPVVIQAQDIKIGVVDLQTVMEKSEPGQKAIKQLQSEFEEMKSELDTKKAAIDQLRQELQKQSLALSQEAQMDKETEYKQKVRDFQDLYQSYQRKMQLKEEKLREPIIEKLVGIIKDYGEKKGYTLIMDKKNSGVVYSSEAIEITKPVIAELNKVWKNKN
ncbi:MAG: OmpH family outer membrane protein [Desulfovermiculus sp.]|nr:OmpH family outer membrane protein [Desulfovermiculus sp.]